MELARVPLRRIVFRLAEGIDSTLLVILLTLSLLGLAVLFSASYENPGRVTSQVANLAVAVAAMWLVAQVHPQTMMRFAVPAYVVGLAFLVAVALFGDVVNGARRWLHVGVTRFQPSEMMKLALPLMLAWYFHKHEATLKLRNFAVGALLLIVPLALICGRIRGIPLFWTGVDLSFAVFGLVPLVLAYRHIRRIDVCPAPVRGIDHA